MAISLTKWIKSLVVSQEGTTTPNEIELTPGGSASTKTTITGAQTSNVTVTMPNATDTLVGRATTDTLSNKTLDVSTIANLRDDRLSIQDDADVSKQLRFDSSAITTGTTRTLTAPDANTTIVGTDVTQTLTNKTLTSPVINSPTGITKSDVGLGNVDNTSDATKNAAAVSLTNKTIDADQNTITNIENADVKAGAAIDYSKLAALTASRVLVSEGSGFVSASSVTSTTLGYLDATSSIQTQLNAKAATSAVVLKTDYTAKGAILAASAASTPTDLPVGADGTVLTASSGQTTGLIWATPTDPALNITAQTSTYSAAIGDYVLASGSAFTVTLPTAVGVSGKAIRIKKTDSSLSNIITIATTSAQTIDGFSTRKLATQNESITLYSDGANWQITERRIPSYWISQTATGSWNTNTTYTMRMRRVGDTAEFDLTVATTGAPNNTALTVNLPITIDTAKMSAFGDFENFGVVNIRDSGVAIYVGKVSYSSTTAITISSINSTPALLAFSASNPMVWANGDHVHAIFRVPVVDWEG